MSDGMFVLDVEPVPGYKTAASTVDRSKLPATGTPPSLELPPPARARLSNGLEVVVVERHEAPLVDFTLISDAGFAADSLAQPGTARLRDAHAPGGHEVAHVAADRGTRRVGRRDDRRGRCRTGSAIRSSCIRT